MAAALAPQDLTEDSICPNVTQNIFVVCTPSERNARAYTTVQQLRMRETLYRVAVYPAPPDDTCKGVIRGIDIDLNDNQLRELIVTKRNPSALEVKRIKNTMTVTMLFSLETEPLGRCQDQAIAAKQTMMTLRQSQYMSLRRVWLTCWDNV
ncbi:hypothetical protein MTO96_046613 [Rhipicephalus appendiculatus]